MSKNTKKALKLFFDEKAPLHAAMDKYEKSMNEIDQLIATKCEVSFTPRAEIFNLYHIEGLLVAYQIGILSANRRAKKLIKTSMECDIHKTKQLYLRECINSTQEWCNLFFSNGPYRLHKGYFEK